MEASLSKLVEDVKEAVPGVEVTAIHVDSETLKTKVGFVFHGVHSTVQLEAVQDVVKYHGDEGYRELVKAIRDHLLIQSHPAEEIEPGVFEGTVLVADTPTINGTIYSSDVLKKAAEDYNKRDVKVGMEAIQGTQSGDKVELSKVSHNVSKLVVEDGKLVARVELLKTPMGKSLSKIIEAMRKQGKDLNVGLFVRGKGSLTKKGGWNVVDDDFTIVSIDIGSESSRMMGNTYLSEGFVCAPSVFDRDPESY